MSHIVEGSSSCRPKTLSCSSDSLRRSKAISATLEESTQSSFFTRLSQLASDSCRMRENENHADNASMAISVKTPTTKYRELMVAVLLRSEACGNPFAAVVGSQSVASASHPLESATRAR